MSTRSVGVPLIGLLFAVSSSFAETNSWTKTTSGYWEEPFWSLGQLPSASQEAIVFTNAGSKALAIGASTVASHPESLQINHFHVDAPTNSHNLLLLNYAGLNVPLTTATTYIGRDGSLLSYYSAIRADQLNVNGRATFAEFAESQVGLARIGTFRVASMGPGTNTAELTLSNGLFSASGIDLAEGVPGAFNQYGGSSHIGALVIGTEGIFSLAGGALNVSNSVSLRGSARLNITGGTAAMTGLGFSESPARGGEVVLSDGTLRASFVVASDAHFAQSGGRAELRDVQFTVGALDSSDYMLSGGVLITSNFSARVLDRGDFDFEQSSGIHTNTGSIVLSSPASRRGESAYHFMNGLLFTPHLELPNGLFFQEAGTARVQRISLSGWDGSYLQSGGTTHAQELSITEGASYHVRGGQLWTSNATVQFAADLSFARPLIWLNGGEHHVQRRLLLDSGGVYVLENGVLAAPFINLEGGGWLQLNGGGNIATNELLTIRGGILESAGGEYRFGGLRVPGDSRIDFPFNPGTLRFTDAGYTNGALNARLSITNWTAGSDHLYVGTNAHAITSDQLSLIRFVNPSSYPPGTYNARVTSSGEIVPVEPGTLSHSRTQNGMVLTWPEGYALYTSAIATGPYQPVPGATSPYPISFTDPQRFFLVRPMQ